MTGEMDLQLVSEPGIRSISSISSLGCKDIAAEISPQVSEMSQGQVFLTEVPHLPSGVPKLAAKDLKLIKLIGEGGMGQVYSARWIETLVAVKLLRYTKGTPLNKYAGNAYEHEVSMLSKLRHPCICTIFGTAIIDDQCALILEYLEGGSLHELLRRGQRSGSTLQPAKLCRIASQISAGLAYLHRNGVIHRDVKSANVCRGRSNRANKCCAGLIPPRPIRLWSRCSWTFQCSRPRWLTLACQSRSDNSSNTTTPAAHPGAFNTPFAWARTGIWRLRCRSCGSAKIVAWHHTMRAAMCTRWAFFFGK